MRLQNTKSSVAIKSKGVLRGAFFLLLTTGMGACSSSTSDGRSQTDAENDTQRMSAKYQGQEVKKSAPLPRVASHFEEKRKSSRAAQGKQKEGSEPIATKGATVANVGGAAPGKGSNKNKVVSSLRQSHDDDEGLFGGVMGSTEGAAGLGVFGTGRGAFGSPGTRGDSGGARSHGFGKGGGGLGGRGLSSREISGGGSRRVFSKSSQGRIAKPIHIVGKQRGLQPRKNKTLNKGGTFKHAGINPMTETNEDKFSTFAVDVDTGSYFFGRGYLARGDVPPKASVRVEEWVNAFHYGYGGPSSSKEAPFAVHMKMAPSPFTKSRQLLRIGVQGKRVSSDDRLPIHLTFLVDTSGSMRSRYKLPMVKKSLHILTRSLRRDDSIALVTYAGSSLEVLPATSLAHPKKIHAAIDRLGTSGGTHMSSGMKLAYRNAGKHLGSDRMSRVIVLSDGDANIGQVGHDEILKSIRGYVSEGITLSTIGFGRGNYNDHLMEQLADAGNGNYSYVDSDAAAQKLFTKGLVGMLNVIAQDVKIQVEMNPQYVSAYRLVGYENRDMADKDFRNDKKDAGEIGSGHAVTALYELEFVGEKMNVQHAKDFVTVRIRHKEPRGQKAKETQYRLKKENMESRFEDLDDDTRWAVSVALTSEILRGSPHVAHLRLADARAYASEALGEQFKMERDAFLVLLASSAARN